MLVRSSKIEKRRLRATLRVAYKSYLILINLKCEISLPHLNAWTNSSCYPVLPGEKLNLYVLFEF